MTLKDKIKHKNKIDFSTFKWLKGGRAQNLLLPATAVVIVFSMVLKLEVCNTTWTFGLF